MNYYTVNMIEGYVHDEEADKCFGRHSIPYLIEEYTERIEELTLALQQLDVSSRPDPMDIYKAKLEEAL